MFPSPVQQDVHLCVPQFPPRYAALSATGGSVPFGAGRAYRKVVSRIVADAGTLAAKLWALWQRVAPWVR